MFIRFPQRSQQLFWVRVLLVLSLSGILLLYFTQKFSQFSDIAEEKNASSLPKTVIAKTKLIIDPIKLELPDTNEGDLAEGQVTFTNHGSHTIREIKIVASCSCSASSLSGDAIPPGKSVPAKISIRTTGKIGDYVGQFVVTYSDGQQVHKKKFSALVHINATGKIEAIPSAIICDDLLIGNHFQETIYLRPVDSSVRHSTAIVDVETPSWITSDLKASGTGWKLRLSGIIPNYSGARVEQIRVLTNSERYPVMVVPVILSIKGPLEFVPSRIIKVMQFTEPVHKFNVLLVTPTKSTFHLDISEIKGIPESVLTSRITPNDDNTFTIHFVVNSPPNSSMKRVVAKGDFILEARVNGEKYIVSLPILIINHKIR